jgi:hypothetical protein
VCPCSSSVFANEFLFRNAVHLILFPTIFATRFYVDRYVRVPVRFSSVFAKSISIFFRNGVHLISFDGLFCNAFYVNRYVRVQFFFLPNRFYMPAVLQCFCPLSLLSELVSALNYRVVNNRSPVLLPVCSVRSVCVCQSDFLYLR